MPIEPWSSRFQVRVGDKHLPVVDVAYLAGIIDGEGCISITKPTNKCPSSICGLVVLVANTNEPIIDWIQSTFGGNKKAKKRNNDRAKVCYTWLLQGYAAEALLEAVLPYLRVKKVQGQLGLGLLRGKRLAGGNSNTNAPYPEHFRKEIEQMRALMNYLNKRGPRESLPFQQAAP